MSNKNISKFVLIISIMLVTVSDIISIENENRLSSYIVEYIDELSIKNADSFQSQKQINYESQIEMKTGKLPKAKFKKIFSGAAIDASKREIEEIKKLPFVKNVYPDEERHIHLSDSIPLIGADDAWSLTDASGNNLTGKGVKIAILDTGVDYTHEDLGGCFGRNNANYFELAYNDETFVFELTDPQKIVQAERILNGEITNKIHVMGKIVKEKRFYNNQWSYIIDPSSVEFFQAAIEVCDSSISGVEEHLDEVGGAFLPNNIWCPWGSVLTRKIENPNCKVADGYDFVNNDYDPMDDNGHGTHVASIAAGNGILRGVAPDAIIYAYKVSNAYGTSQTSTILTAMDAALDPNNDDDISDHVDIISMSLGGNGNPDDILSRAVDSVVDLGIIVVVSAGNDWYQNTINSPGTARRAITIGESTKDDRLTYTTSRGPVIWDKGRKIMFKPDVVAPGQAICAARFDSIYPEQTCIGNNHVLLSGTSMAAPHVSGLAALVKQLHPDWTPLEIKAAIKNTAKKFNAPLHSQGFGRIDALAAVNIKESSCIAFLEPVKNRNFGLMLDIEGIASCRNFGSWKLEYSQGLYSEDWKILKESSEQTTEMLFSDWDISSLEDGLYMLRLTVSDNEGINGFDFSMFNVSALRQPINSAKYITQNVQQQMVKNKTYNVSITLLNNGTTTWTAENGYKLYSFVNSWYFPIVMLEPLDVITPGMEKTFSFSITTPYETGTYGFQWRMVQDSDPEWWFGDVTPYTEITIIEPQILTRTFISKASEDGWASRNEARTNNGVFDLGRIQGKNIVKRAFLYFDTSSIPQDAIIKEAKLTVKGYNFAKQSNKEVGNIEIFICSFNPLDKNDFSACLTNQKNNNFINLPETGGAKHVSVSIDPTLIVKASSTQLMLKSQDETARNGRIADASRICGDNFSWNECQSERARPVLEINYVV